MNAPIPKPEQHPWRAYSRSPERNVERARELGESTRALRAAFQEADASSGMHGFCVTHLLVYEDHCLGELYCFRGAYYTLEQWTHSEPGLTRKDLREGESLIRL